MEVMRCVTCAGVYVRMYGVYVCVRMYGVYVCVRMYVCINSFTHCVLCKGDLLTTLLKCDFSLNLCPYFCLMLINIFFQDNKISVGSQE